MKNKKASQKRGARKETPIYNSHIHTFTIRSTPIFFHRLLLREFLRTLILKIPASLKWILFGIFLLFLPTGVSLLLSKYGLNLFPSELSGLFLEPLVSISSLLARFQSLMLLVFVLLVLVIIVAILITTPIVILLEIISILTALVKWFNRKRPSRNLTKINSSLLSGRGLVLSSTYRFTPFDFVSSILTGINPASNDSLERIGRFLKTSGLREQSDVFDVIGKQYPENAVFVVLPMDMTFMGLGALGEPIEQQHSDLLDLANNSNGKIVPFYAADPRHKDIVDRVKTNLGPGGFRGIKIYPNLGYYPNDEKLLRIFKICIEQSIPVMTHCSPGGIWMQGLTIDDRKGFARPSNYKAILDQKEYRNLKICLAHFGGAEEWEKHLKGRSLSSDSEEPWVRTIREMLESDKYPNLYTDISYTVFTPKFKGLHIEMIDYLKVMLESNQNIREHVLFGSDYYMVEQEKLSEKEVSILLRSRLGDDLFFQIANKNPRKFLGIR